MAQLTTNFEEALKEVFNVTEEDFRDYLNNASPTYSRFPITSNGVVEGKYIKLADLIGRNAGFSFLGEGETVATAGHLTFMNQFVNTKKAIGTLAFSSEVMRRAATDTAAVADAMGTGKKNLRSTAVRELNYLLHHSGDGIIAALDTNTTTTTLALDPDTPYSDLNYLEDMVAAGGADSGLNIDIVTTSTGAVVVANRQVEAVDKVNKTIEISGATVSTTTAQSIVRSGQSSANNLQRVVSSLPQMIDDTGALYGADPSTYPMWASRVEDFTGQAVSDTLFEEAFDALDIRTGNVFGDSSAAIFTTHQVRREIVASMKDRVRYEPLEFRGGFKKNLPTLAAGGGDVAILTDRDCKDQTAYLVNTDDIKNVVAEDWQWVEEAGSPLFYDRSDDSYHLSLRSSREFIIRDRRSSMKMTGVGSAVSAPI